MDEFNNRINAQRSVLKLINEERNRKEELVGLSKKAIDRWISVNSINPENDLCKIIFEISEKLFFLATKSQEQISEDYKQTSIKIGRLQEKLKLLTSQNTTTKRHRARR